MSGGYFDYKQFHINDITEAIEEIIQNNGLDPRWDFTPETISEFRTALEYLRCARVYAHRIDYLLCSDDSEESFHERLNEELD